VAPWVFRFETGKIDPREVGNEPRAPDDVRYVEDSLVRQHRQPVAHAHNPGHPLDPRSGEIAGTDPDERSAAGEDLRSDLAADGRVHGQHSVEQESEYQAKQQPCRHAVDAAGDVTDIPARQPRGVIVGDIQGDIGSRVTGAHHEDTAVTQLDRVAVFMGMQLNDAGIELGGERRLARALEAAHGHDHVVGLDPAIC
jgi:hypothetical protein